MKNKNKVLNYRSLFQCTTYQAAFILVILVTLHLIIYFLYCYVIRNYFSTSLTIQGIFSKSESQSRIWVYFDQNASRFKSNASDYGDVLSINDHTGDYDSRVISKIKSIKSRRVVYQDITTYNATLWNVMFMAPIRYLKEFKNPCFTQKGKHPDSNEVVHYLRCLPYFFVAGFTKCGTTDFHARLTRHPLVGAGWTKEPHWWDDIYHKSAIMEKYTGMFQSVTDLIASSHIINNKNRKKYHPIVIGDFTPRTIWHGNDWSHDILNVNESEPKVLIPHKIKYVIPMAKIIVLTRNPTERLYSDYIDLTVRYNMNHHPPSPAHFNQLVINAIRWWNDCLTNHSEQVCAYGYPSSQPPLDEELGRKWLQNTADRLRIGLYAIYLQNWFNIFGKENIEVIQLEKYKINPVNYIKKHILPFLDLPAFPRKALVEAKQMKPINTKSVRLDPELDVVMWNSTRLLLDRFYHSYNERLNQMLSRNL